MNEVLYERELLFLADNKLDLGEVKVKLLGINNNARMIAVVSPKFDLDLYKYTENIISSMNTEMFLRLKIDFIKNVDIIFDNKIEAKKIVFESENSILPYHFVNISQEESEFIK